MDQTRDFSFTPAGLASDQSRAARANSPRMLMLEKYTVGVGDRFAHQAKAQLQACIQVTQEGIELVPVWNKSNREHLFIGSEPQSVFDAAQAAVKALGWTKGWH